MRVQSLFITLLGLAIAGGSVFFAREYMMDPNGQAIASTPEIETVDLIIVRSDIEFGQEVERHMLSTQTWPKDLVPEGIFMSFEEILGEQGSEPRRTRTKLYAGELILEPKLSDFGEKVTIVQKLGKNTRAMAIKVDAVTAVGGFVTPGDFVDIVLTQGSRDNLRAVTILQNIRVIGVDQHSEETSESPEIARTITVEVSPDQGQKLALAQKAGTLSLTLRTLDAVEDKPLDMVGIEDLLQEKSPTEEVDRGPKITVRRGTSSEVIRVDNN